MYLSVRVEVTGADLLFGRPNAGVLLVGLGLLTLPGGLPRRFVDEADAVVMFGEVTRFLGGLPRRFGVTAAIASEWREFLGGCRFVGISAEKETLLAVVVVVVVVLGLVSVRLPGVVRMDLGGRPRGRLVGIVFVLMLVSEVRARMAGVVRVDLGGRPRFLGAGVEAVAMVDASEISALRLSDDAATVWRAGVGPPTVELSETLAFRR